jgi:hypothetical protein
MYCVGTMYSFVMLQQLVNIVTIATLQLGHINPLALELDIYILAHHLCKM